MRNLLIIAESKWAPSPRCPPMTEQWRLRRCYTSDYFFYPWVISNLRSTLSKQVDITRCTPIKITEFLLEEEADDNKNLRLLSLPHPGRRGIITTFICHYRHPPFVLDEFVQRAVVTWSDWGIVDQRRLLQKGKKKRRRLINKPHDVSQQMMLIMIEKLLANHGNIPEKETPLSSPPRSCVGCSRSSPTALFHSTVVGEKATPCGKSKLASLSLHASKNGSACQRVWAGWE